VEHNYPPENYPKTKSQLRREAIVKLIMRTARYTHLENCISLALETARAHAQQNPNTLSLCPRSYLSLSALALSSSLSTPYLERAAQSSCIPCQAQLSQTLDAEAFQLSERRRILLKLLHWRI